MSIITIIIIIIIIVIIIIIIIIYIIQSNYTNITIMIINIMLLQGCNQNGHDHRGLPASQPLSCQECRHAALASSSGGHRHPGAAKTSQGPSPISCTFCHVSITFCHVNITFCVQALSDHVTRS